MSTKLKLRLALGFGCIALSVGNVGWSNWVSAQGKGPPPPPVPLRARPVSPTNTPPIPPVVEVAPVLPSSEVPVVNPKPVLVLPDIEFPTDQQPARVAPLAVGNAQPIVPPVTPSPVMPVINPKSSQVFPDGGFPETIPTPITVSTAISQQQQVVPVTPPKPAAEYGFGGLDVRGDQNAPGSAAYYNPVSGIIPSYYFTQEYYMRPVVGPQGGTEPAPLGYEAREYQDAPGVPEYTLITPPPDTTPEERQKFVTRGLFPGSYLVPGTNTSIRLRGFVRLTGIYDFKPIGTPDIFVVNTIPVPQTSGQNLNETARPSRFALESWTPTSFRDWAVHTFIEGDFFNGPGQAAGGGGNPFRLRHAFVDHGYFRVGQQNTVFMDGNTWPSLVDFQGPAGWVNQRRPGARMTLPIGDSVYWATGVEQPFSDITTNGLGTAVQDVPDFATNIRYESGFGHVQVSGLARAIGYRPTGGDVTRRSAYGMSASTTFHPWAVLMGSNPLLKANPTGLERCRIIGQYTCGWGIGRYFLDTVGLGLDGQVDPLTGGLDLPYAAGWLVSYEHWFTEKWMAQSTWSETLVASNGGQPSTTYTGGKYVAASLWYIPFRNLSLGTELLWGERENLNEDRGRARRLNALVQYNF